MATVDAVRRLCPCTHSKPPRLAACTPLTVPLAPPAVKAALPDGCKYPGKWSADMPVWRDDGSQIASVDECWVQCTVMLPEVVAVDFWPAGWENSTAEDSSC